MESGLHELNEFLSMQEAGEAGGLEPETPIDMALLDLVNLRLDHVKVYNSGEHFRHVLYHGRRWVKEWPELACSEITIEMVEAFIIKRSAISTFTANKDLRYDLHTASPTRAVL